MLICHKWTLKLIFTCRPELSHFDNVVWFYSVLLWQQTTPFQVLNSLTVLRMSHLRMPQIVNRAFPWRQTNLIRLKTQVTADYNNDNCTVKPFKCQLAHNVITLWIFDGFLWILLQKLSCEDLLIEVIKLWPPPTKDILDQPKFFWVECKWNARLVWHEAVY